MSISLSLIRLNQHMQKLQQKTPPQKQIQKAVHALNKVLDKKGDGTLTVTPMDLFESGAMSRTSFFRYFSTIDSIVLFAQAELTEVISVYNQRKALYLRLSRRDFFMMLLNTLYSQKEIVKLLIRRPSKRYWQETLVMIKPIIDRTFPKDEEELFYELFVLVFVHTLEWWIENGFRKEDIPPCVDRIITLIHILDQSNLQNIFVVKKLLTSIWLMIK